MGIWIFFPLSGHSAHFLISQNLGFQLPAFPWPQREIGLLPYQGPTPVLGLSSGPAFIPGASILLLLPNTMGWPCDKAQPHLHEAAQGKHHQTAFPAQLGMWKWHQK